MTILKEKFKWQRAIQFDIKVSQSCNNQDNILKKKMTWDLEINVYTHVYNRHILLWLTNIITDSTIYLLIRKVCRSIE